MKRNTYKILGVKLDSITLEESIGQLDHFVEKKSSTILTTPNSEFIIKSQTDDDFRHIINDVSGMNLPDSFGMLWAARFSTLWAPKTPILREIVIFFEWIFSIILVPLFPKCYYYPLKSKISGSDYIWMIAKWAAEKKHKLFLFGGAPTVAELAALKLQTAIYNLRVAGIFPGDISRENEAIEAIKRSKAEILLVCLGAPLQEKWLDKNLTKTGCKIGIGLGGTFDFTAGIVSRAPKWMQMSGLEWLFRLIIQPKRIGRQLALPKMMYLVLLERLKSR